MIINNELITKVDKWLLDNYEEEYIDAVLDMCSKDVFDVELEDSFSTKLIKIISSKGLNESDVYNKALVDRRVFSKIRNNVDYKPKKNTALALCIALKLNIDDTEDLINRAGYSLSRSDKKDVVIRYVIENEIDYDVLSVDQLLTYYELETLIKY